jgi:hypothetical protein
MNWKGCERKRSCPALKYCPCIYQEQLRKNTYQNISLVWIYVKAFAKLSVLLQNINFRHKDFTHGQASRHTPIWVKVKVCLRLTCTVRKDFWGSGDISAVEWGESPASCSGRLKFRYPSDKIPSQRSGQNGLLFLPGIESCFLYFPPVSLCCRQASKEESSRENADWGTSRNYCYICCGSSLAKIF